MDSNQLFEQIKKKESFLCVGLDTDIKKIPACLLSEENPVFSFNKAIIDATAAYTVCYKPNLAFYEVLGDTGWQAFIHTVQYIRKNYPDIFIIADAKRGDIGNTSQMYAKTFFETANADAVTLSPYMGHDTAEPFLAYQDKWGVLLALTSNPSASDFETERMASGECLYETVIKKSKEWGDINNIMYVVGATQAKMLENIRKIIPEHFLLVPGVGAQGGSLEEVARYGMNSKCGLLVNSSRGIIYADKSEKFAEAAGQKAFELQQAMKKLLNDFCY